MTAADQEISSQRLPTPIWPPKWRMTGERMSGNLLRPMTCWPESFTPISWERRSSQRIRPAGWTSGLSWRWRRSFSGRVRRPKQWQPRFFDSLRHRSHCLRGGQGRRESWPTSFSLRRPPRRDRMGEREIAQRRSSPRRSGGNESASWNARRSLAAILTKAKNTKCRNYKCFFLLRFSRNHVFTPRTSTEQLKLALSQFFN